MRPSSPDRVSAFAAWRLWRGKSARQAAGIVLLVAAAAQAQGSSLRDRMLAAEDARASSASEMAPLLEGLRASDMKVLIQAVRALGRFERPQLVPHLLPLVGHRRPEVRAEALNALGQALAAIPRASEDQAPLPSEVALVSSTLAARLRVESDPYVTGIAAETFGRLPFRTAHSVRDVEAALARLLPIPQGAEPIAAGTEPLARVVHPVAVIGAVKGLETRIRLYQKLAPVQPATIARLRGAATLGSDPSDTDLAFIRRVAWSALNSAASADVALVDHGLEDPDLQVRRLATIALANPNIAATDRSTRLNHALGDSSFMVRYEAVRVYNRTTQTASCQPLLTAVEDRSMHVALAAIDALGDGCPAGPSPIATLIQLSDSVAPPKPPGEGRAAPGRHEAEWHRAAHAFVALARVARDHAAGRMAVLAEHRIWQVRMYAARAAAAMLSETRLERLAGDAHDNVREAAIAGLVAVRGHRADSFYVAALARSDYQLVLTAANALKGSPNGERAVPELLEAFARVTSEHRDTSRDVRVAILERLKEFGPPHLLGPPKPAGSGGMAALQSCLTDFDPEVARQCAAVLSAWTGTPHAARPAPRSNAPVLFVAARRARIAMQRGGAFELRLFTDDAPATVARFVNLARKGYYNGLTFHRVVPNFVVQGGSPGANEYMGDGPFMRDEVGLRTHARGTLGISTRGRDTGDAQIFVNLTDNPRLDHHYTVFAEVAIGMDVVDGIVEGDVIERVDVLEPSSSQSSR
jgi:cyclophilin family peptidyl-prolyl cis-trans isomerase/HEAT repeat protein